MLNYTFPVILITVFNVFYNICAKSVPEKVNAFASLNITYATATIITFLLLCLNKSSSEGIFLQYKNINWASFMTGMLIVGLEYGYVQAFRVGWNISTFSVVTNICLAIALIFVGILLYKEHISPSQILGILLCIGGLFFINKR
ncbi:EamA family transporter [Clostridium sp. P21]|uniref:EamA family transporter n=1 Tax=Clostridium muellerianum TaxID=2716538 RepID=A0A7Y0HNL5_9CLOT|nr:EamA family transporter [Clostridium muellerianum]NMM61728.1 EamA family transporter [Clostridium muellerianum]